MKRLIGDLKRAGILPHLTDLLPPGQSCWLVGGAPRDTLLGRQPLDFDLATSGDPTSLARRFAEKGGWTWFVLDAKRSQSRAVRQVEGRKVSVDFAPLRAATLDGDLLLRDFTCNALALPLTAGGAAEAFYDPLGGEKDLQAKLLRACSATVLLDDPLRTLKGVRHMVELGLAPEAATTALMLEAASLLDRPAPERIRCELLRIIACDRAVEGVELMSDLNLLPPLLGSWPAGGTVEAVAAIGRLVAAEEGLRRLGQGAPIDEPLEEGLALFALVRLAALLERIGPVHAMAAAGRLRLSRRASKALSALLAMEPGEIRGPGASSPRGRALWLARFGPVAAATALYLAAQPAIGAEVTAQALSDWWRLQQGGRIPELVGGAWIEDELGIGGGPVIGRMLAALRREELCGRVTTAGQGMDFLRRLGQNRD